MKQIKLSESTAARRQFYFVAKDVNNPAVAKTGLAGTWAAADIQISKNGAAPANSAGTVTEVDATNLPGLYYYTFTTTEINALGSVLLNIKNANMVAQTHEVQVVAYDPYDSVRMGMLALPNAAANAAGGLFTRGTGAGQISQAINGTIDVNLVDWKGTAPSSLDSGGNVPADTMAINGGTFGVLAWLGVIDINQAQAGSTATTIVLNASSTWANDVIKGATVYIYAGTGAGQTRSITAYNSATKTATVDVAWTTTPDATSFYAIRAVENPNTLTIPSVNVTQWLGSAPSALVSGRVDASLGDVQSITSVNNALGIVTAGTAIAGTANTLTLAASASGTANIYIDDVILTTGGTGAGQARRISAYTTGKVATVVPNWTVTPDATTTYIVFRGARADVALWGGSSATPSAVNALVSGRVDSSTGAMAANVVTASAISAAALTAAKFGNDVNVQVIRTATMQAGSTATTAKLDASSSATDDFYKGAEIYIVSGTGAGQARTVSGYVGATKVATVNRAWVTTPDATSVFQLLATDAYLQTADIGAVWDQPRASHTTAGTFGEGAASVQGNVTGSVASVTGNVGGNVVGSVASVTGAVGSVTGNVGGNVVGSVASVTGAVGSVTGNVGGNVVGSVGSVLTVTNVTNIINGVLDALLSDHSTVGSLADGVAIAAGLLQGNCFIDTVNNTDPNGQTSCRIRLWRDAASMAGVTSGGSGEGEFASFNVTTSYTGVNKMATHKVIRTL